MASALVLYTRILMKSFGAVHDGLCFSNAMAELCLTFCDISFWFASLFTTSSIPGTIYWEVAHTFAASCVVVVSAALLVRFIDPEHELMTLVSIRLLCGIYRAVLCPLVLGRARSRMLLCNRYVRSRFELQELDWHVHPTREKFLLAWRWLCIIYYHIAQVYSKRPLRAWQYAFCVFMTVLPHFNDLASFWWKASRPKAWRLSYGGFHLGDAYEAMDDDHGVCGICLDSLCDLTSDIAQERRMVHCWKAGLSLSRLRGSRGQGLASISPLRCRFNSLSRRVATLQCGHAFHAECIEYASRHQPQCPTCRRVFANTDNHAALTPEELAHVHKQGNTLSYVFLGFVFVNFGVFLIMPVSLLHVFFDEEEELTGNIAERFFSIYGIGLGPAESLWT